MRLGWDDLSAPELARRAERVGARAVTVHGRTRMQFYNGTADWRAPVKTNAIDMSAALLAAKVPFRMVLFEGAQHGVIEFRDEARRIMHDWLDTYVRDRKSWPSLEPHGD